MLRINIITFLFFPLIFANPEDSSKSNQNKTKRTISDQIYNHGDGKAVLFYMESPQAAQTPELQTAGSSPVLRTFYPAPAKPLALVSVQQPIQVFEQDGPKQVTEQQVLYEFQQTPTNAVSNVHVKQLFQPNSIELTTPNPLLQSQSSQASELLPTTQPLGSIQPSTPIITANQGVVRAQPQLASPSNHYPAATIVSPVQHNLFTNHGLNTASFSYHNPVLPEPLQFQNTHIPPKQTPGKYIYLNGKIVYNPAHIIQQGRLPQNSIYHKGIYHNQQKLPLINYAQKNIHSPVQPGTIRSNLGIPYAGVRPLGRFTPSPHLPPITNNRFQPPKQLQQIDKPSLPLQRDEAEEDGDEEKGTKEEDDEEVEDDEEEAEDENKDDEKEEKDQNDKEENDSEEFETYPFEEDDYVEDDENHYFKPKYRKYNKSRDEHRDEDREYDPEEDEDDSKRGASKHVARYHHHPNQSKKYKNPSKFEKGTKSGYHETYSSNTKHKTAKNSKNSKHDKPVGKFKKVKFSKVNGGKPKIERIEGRYSENIPVVHKHKVYKERWYVTKNIEGADPSSDKKKVNY